MLIGFAVNSWPLALSGPFVLLSKVTSPFTLLVGWFTKRPHLLSLLSLEISSLFSSQAGLLSVSNVSSTLPPEGLVIYSSSCLEYPASKCLLPHFLQDILISQAFPGHSM